MARLTTNQREVLLRLGWMSGAIGKFVSAAACGQPAALEHLAAKGYAERLATYGPRGGEHLSYRLTEAGLAVYDRHHSRVAATTNAKRTMPAHEIDTRLIAARREGRPVLVYCGSPAYVRGVPGEVERDADDGHVKLKIGQRTIALMAITEVTDG